MKRPKKTLGEEDQKLWSEVKKTAKPLKEDITYSLPKTEVYVSPIVNTPRVIDPKPRAKPTPKTSIETAPSLSEHFDSARIVMDKKKYTKMKTGKLSPEGKIDLHGMTLAQAQPALTQFVLSSAQSGKRLVLVITGKGKRSEVLGPIPQKTGVLKHAVPQWLSSFPLAPVILQVTQAHQKHGGDGAYYVYLRRQK